MTMNSAATSTCPGRRRAGFTLLELLVVTTIIVLLAVLLVPAIGRMLGGAREKVTAATIQKVDGIIRQRVRALDQLDLTREIAGLKLNPNYSGWSDAAIKAYLRKEKMKQAFPQTFAEAGLSAPSGHNPATESAEVLYHALVEREVIGVAGVSPDHFQSNEVADTDGDGRMEFVDGWGRPLRFYRWPTRLVRPGGNGASVNKPLVDLLITGISAEMLGQDPDDPLGEFAATPAFNEQSYHTADTYHVPLLVSAGADEALGLFEPHDKANFGHLAQPTAAVLADPGNSPLNDNISNRQPLGGN
ncbi:MAG: type II secretion system protein [Planctomycetales bacterium]